MEESQNNPAANQCGSEAGCQERHGELAQTLHQQPDRIDQVVEVVENLCDAFHDDQLAHDGQDRTAIG